MLRTLRRAAAAAPRGAATAARAGTTLRGTVAKVVFRAPDGAFAIARLERGEGHEPFTATGPLGQLQPGESVELQGAWTRHHKFGEQFAATHAAPVGGEGGAGGQDDPAALRLFLGSGLLPGIGPALAQRIVARFGAETVQVLEREPQRLREVSGIGRKVLEGVERGWEAHRASRELVAFLQGHGLGVKLALRVFSVYGTGALAQVKRQPYQLVGDVRGVGFATADSIALAAGVAPDSPFRADCALREALARAALSGHCCLPLDELTAAAGKLLGLRTFEFEADPEAVGAAVEAALQEGRLCLGGADGAAVALPATLRLEQELALRVRRLADARLPPVDEAAVARLLGGRDVDLSPEQREAVMQAIFHPLSVLTGGPGVGKTISTRAIVRVWRRLGKRVTLVSPTARSARVLGDGATTIHRALGPDGRDGFRHHEQNPLPCDAIVVDEASMLDLELATALLRAVRPGCSVLLVGDADQLPSVGAGAVLADLIESAAVPVTHLRRVFRQALSSDIVKNAHAINAGGGSVAAWAGLQSEDSDCLFVPADDPGVIVGEVLDRVAARGFDLGADVQVLAPVKRGAAGTWALNEALRARLNPGARGPLAVGDLVLQTANDYDREVFNGEAGAVVGVTEEAVTVLFDDEREVEFDATHNDLELAFATTVHKAQGSERPVVICPLFMAHYHMLSRNLLYTAITRASKLVVVVGEARAFHAAVRNDTSLQRHTSLGALLAAGAAGGDDVDWTRELDDMLRGLSLVEQMRRTAAGRDDEGAQRLGVLGPEPSVSARFVSAREAAPAPVQEVQEVHEVQAQAQAQVQALAGPEEVQDQDQPVDWSATLDDMLARLPLPGQSFAVIDGRRVGVAPAHCDCSDFALHGACEHVRQAEEVLERGAAVGTSAARPAASVGVAAGAGPEPWAVAAEAEAAAAVPAGPAAADDDVAPPYGDGDAEWTVAGSKPGVEYTVRREGDQLSCTCPGFTYRKTCKHVKAASS